MKPVFQLCLTLVWLMVFGGVSLSEAPTEGNIHLELGKKVVCKDCDEFCINERQTVETGNFTMSNGDLIVVEKRYLRLTLYRDGNVLKRYTVAVGKPETPTPVGEWKIINKGGKWGGAFGDRWMGINCPWGIYGIHGTDKPGSIGRMSSHGCIRMHNRNVMELYSLVQ
ncbi:MAG TPA: L,D-transpeptidase, partial [Bacillota bacterium]|nr:L,D-transpeptidase [Bacillota bacterium]